MDLTFRRRDPGYAIGSFYKQASKLEEICQQHTHVNGDGGSVVSIDSARPARNTA